MCRSWQVAMRHNSFWLLKAETLFSYFLSPCCSIKRQMSQPRRNYGTPKRLSVVERTETERIEMRESSTCWTVGGNTWTDRNAQQPIGRRVTQPFKWTQWAQKPAESTCILHVKYMCNTCEMPIFHRWKVQAYFTCKIHEKYAKFLWNTWQICVFHMWKVQAYFPCKINVKYVSNTWMHT